MLCPSLTLLKAAYKQKKPIVFKKLDILSISILKLSS